jgi:hypothetical protein
MDRLARLAQDEVIERARRLEFVVAPGEYRPALQESLELVIVIESSHAPGS